MKSYLTRVIKVTNFEYIKQMGIKELAILLGCIWSDFDDNIRIINGDNILDSFKLDYDTFFSNQGYISNSIKKKTFDRYYLYFNQYVGDKEQFQRMIDNYVDLRIDYKALIFFTASDFHFKIILLALLLVFQLF